MMVTYNPHLESTHNYKFVRFENFKISKYVSKLESFKSLLPHVTRV
jgi:hypothetical protein